MNQRENNPSLKKLIATVLIFLVESPSVAAERNQPTQWMIKDNNCPTLLLKKTIWEKTINTLPIDFKISGLIDKQSGGNWIIYRDGLKIKAAKTSCFSPIGFNSKDDEDVFEKSSEDSEDSKPSEIPRRFTLSAFSGVMIWSETLIGAQSNGNSLTLRSLNEGFRVGGRLGIPVSNMLDLGVELAGIVGGGEIYSKETEYRASGSHFGVMATPSINWINEDGSWRLGLGTPLYFRRSTWPDPETGIQLPQKSKVYSGLTLHTLLSSGSWSLLPQIGFFESTNHWILLFDISLRL